MAAGPEVMVLNEQFFDNSVSNETQIDELLQFVEPRLVAKVKSSFFFVIAVVSICVGTLGISGNTLSIFVLSTKDLKKSPASGMLRWLAVWDSITIVSLVFFMDYVNVVWFHATENGKIFTYWFPLIHKVSDPLFATATMESVSMTLLLTWERYRAGLQPIEFSPNMPQIDLGKHGCRGGFKSTGMLNETRKHFTTTPIPPLDGQIFIVSAILTLPISSFDYLFHAFCCLISTSKSRRSRANRVRDITSSSEPAYMSKSVTKTVVAIVSLSLLSNALFCVYLVLDLLAGTSWAGSPSHGFYAQGMSMILLNSSANFIFYCMFGIKFRTALKNLRCLKGG
ncbi:FMRFamide receptor [Folsomia candida]|uniref:FMRFamide receptor n=1 Tax=Folsomia candida TaxID=158441 RepID=A0A226D3D0_FOLCA|nr:FMRFamide receptor [Folsomia candida]